MEAAWESGGHDGSSTVMGTGVGSSHPFPENLLSDLSGTSAAASRRMSQAERELMLYKRKLRNRESARRSRIRKLMHREDSERGRNRKSNFLTSTVSDSITCGSDLATADHADLAERHDEDVRTTPLEDESNDSKNHPVTQLRELADFIDTLRSGSDHLRRDCVQLSAYIYSLREENGRLRRENESLKAIPSSVSG
mmetsp:Transcript_16240/g.32928  ORF Transcript_16240/g.32928 Transcript_16240/m.32928 type:complete len:196 (+) Transcript_16240:391-978(+)|eukprot:CAMPEP_0184686360 /NCGR_PEP_ID=MMETSP0312-20130426/22125_1 /TAXON_ID=31354 /ORGANISM="Compsopogon coeruleus, Strain SAG 36.94" /LENGTH=195 /DNA_ID=CAMNT_0027141353 /DNA_START=350 /DNA_END=937 /DNA_ORIENTATION=+